MNKHGLTTTEVIVLVIILFLMAFIAGAKLLGLESLPVADAIGQGMSLM